MRFNLVSNIDNGYGLQRDYEIVRAVLESAGHQVRGVQFQHPESARAADVNIFLETLVPIFAEARENWYVPNPEWFEPGRDGKYFGSLTRILCKTRDAMRLFSGFRPGPEISLMGFESRDYYREGAGKQPSWLHVAGKSAVKNTEAIIGAWTRYQLREPLTIVYRRPDFDRKPRTSRMTYIFHVREDRFPELLNRHRFHLCPSEYEGWGHSLHESIGVGAVVITTDAPPMNENRIPQCFLVQPATTEQMRLATLSKVTPEAIASVVTRVSAMSEIQLEHESANNRQRFIGGRTFFRKNLLDLVDRTEEQLRCA